MKKKTKYLLGSIDDFNYDGFKDIIIGCPYGGFASIYYGSPEGVTNTPSLILSEAGWFGWSVSHAGDITGNGQNFIIVGEEFGNAYMYSLTPEKIPIPTTIEAEQMQNRKPWYGSPCEDGWKLTHENHPIYEDVDFLTNSNCFFTITAKGEIAGSAAPWMKVELGDVFKGCCEINSTEWAEYSFLASVTADTHRLSLTYLNDWWVEGVGDRNLLLDKVEITYHTDQVPDTSFTFEAENMRCQHPRNYQDENYIVLHRPYAYVGQEMFFENHENKP